METLLVKKLRDAAALQTKEADNPFEARKGTLEWEAAAKIEWLGVVLQEAHNGWDECLGAIEQIKAHVLPPDSGFPTPPDMRCAIYDRLVEILYPRARGGGWCKHCGCGNDVLGYKHLESCQQPRPPSCNHWPGQKRCEVCGMGSGE